MTKLVESWQAYSVKKMNPINLILAAMLIAGVFLVGRSVYRIYTRTPLLAEIPVSASENSKTQAVLLEQDFKVLDEPKDQTPAEVAKSLRRLKLQNSDVAEKYIAEFIRNPDELIQEAAIELAAAKAPAQYESEIRSALNNQNIKFRLSAINGLRNQSSETSVSLMSNHWSPNIQNPEERLATLITLFSVSQASSEKQTWQNLLVKELESFRGENASDQLVEAFKVLPGNSAVLELAWKIVMGAEADEVSFRALLYLRDFAEPKALKENLGNIRVPRHRRFQLALVDLLFDHCPVGWNNHVKTIMTTGPHPSVKKGLSEAELSVRCL